MRTVGFQSARPHGARLDQRTQGSPEASFNPRARMGRDFQGEKSSPIHNGFNPRARMGRDFERSKARDGKRVSIRAPAWGATRVFFGKHQKRIGFNPRARMGRDIPHA